MKDRYKDINHCIKCGFSLKMLTDRESKDRPQCERCGWIYYKNPIPAVACLVINQENELLLIKRKYEPSVGMWALPSGYIEIWQSPEEAAIQELCEETGLIGEIEHFIDYHNGFSPIYEKVLSLGFRFRIVGGELQAGDDAVEAKYFALDALPEIAFLSHIKFIEKETGPSKKSD
jgi:8-oxo-dGTP diphosphatase